MMSLNLKNDSFFKRTYGIIHLYLHSNIDRHHQVLLLFSRPSTLLASKIIAAFKISVLHKWPPEGFLPKEVSFHAQLSSYAAGKKTEPWHNYNVDCSHRTVKGLDLILQHYSSLAAISVDTVVDCVGTILAGLGRMRALCSASGGIVTIPWILFCRSSLSVLLKDSQSLLLMELISVCPARWDRYGQHRAVESVSFICKGLDREVSAVTSSVVLWWFWCILDL